ncbi:uncharacterized protein BDZ99DRAFT_482586 [Mytilinidion resinicola]|uniref:Uncharacterized protein n=1 Tax=Mytilinidion resinicola TaxID=574789 RepID=A0A6A6Y3W1_9PEZI|nr:uncharacterized protein BDZ99DRAFT_482586 [Mytilinidion resinicola]KAF2802714.1 hypothetical protein BDZ99DRAFT_482586 [Mytilinidion resinicola]
MVMLLFARVSIWAGKQVVVSDSKRQICAAIVPSWAGWGQDDAAEVTTVTWLTLLAESRRMGLVRRLATPAIAVRRGEVSGSNTAPPIRNEADLAAAVEGIIAPDTPALRVSAFGRKRRGDWPDGDAVPLAEDDGDTGLVLWRLWRAWLTDDSCKMGDRGWRNAGVRARDLTLPPPSTFDQEKGYGRFLGTGRKEQHQWPDHDVSSPHQTLAGPADGT